MLKIIVSPRAPPKVRMAVGLSREKLELLAESSERNFLVLMVFKAEKSFSMKTEFAVSTLGLVMCHSEDEVSFLVKMYSPDLFCNDN